MDPSSEKLYVHSSSPITFTVAEVIHLYSASAESSTSTLIKHAQWNTVAVVFKARCRALIDGTRRIEDAEILREKRALETIACGICQRIVHYYGFYRNKSHDLLGNGKCCWLSPGVMDSSPPLMIPGGAE